MICAGSKDLDESEDYEKKVVNGLSSLQGLGPPRVLRNLSGPRIAYRTISGIEPWCLDYPPLLYEDPLDSVLTEAIVSWMILPAKQASSKQEQTAHHAGWTTSLCMVSPILVFAVKFKSRMLNVSNRETHESAREQKHREQRSLSLWMERWLAETSPFCVSVKPEDKETIVLGGSQEGTEHDTVDHSMV